MFQIIPRFDATPVAIDARYLSGREPSNLEISRYLYVYTVYYPAFPAKLATFLTGTKLRMKT